MTAVFLLTPTPSVAADLSLGRLFFLPSERARIDAANHAPVDPCVDPACPRSSDQYASRSKKTSAAQATKKPSQASLNAAQLSGLSVRLDGLLIRADIRRRAVVWLNGARMNAGPQTLNERGLLMSAGQRPSWRLRPGHTYDVVTETIAPQILVRRISEAYSNTRHPGASPYHQPNGQAEGSPPDRTVPP